ncbi:MAG: PQQ-dependent sugar dehydrogenase [Saprospiraceae bacterium]|nr:PQQ-dependent sugar dehydrogenase [Saprospiraceae bacterium]
MFLRRFCVLPAFLLALPLVLFAQPKIELQAYTTGFTRPVDIVHCGDSRLFVVEQAGRIWVLDSLGVRLPGPFLDIVSRVRSTNSEQGLLGLAFPPDYAQTGYFYVNYTRQTDGATRVSRFSVNPGNPNLAEPDSEFILLTQSQPYTNHNAGCLKFSPVDGYLYIAVGDGGSGGDPQNYGQTKNTWLGKILRIDVRSTPPQGQNYVVPPDNPFVNNAAYLPEIWSLGWRNPWRFSFDRLNGAMWVGDVGQSTREEIDFEPAGKGGLNYGWRCYEGNFTYNTSGCQPQSAYVGPVFDFDNNSLGCSVTGGFIYRGSKYSDLYGVYLCTDYCSGRWWGIRQLNDSTFTNIQLADLANNQYSSLGEDRDGELYVAALSQGTIYKITEKCSSFQLSGTVTNATCHGTLDGSIRLQLTGGQTPYTINWNTGQTDTTIIYLDPGAYIAQAQDAQGCIRRDTFEVAANSAVPTPSISVPSWTAPLPDPVLLCPGSDTVLLQAAEAPPGMAYQWYRDGAAINNATQQQYAARIAGDYRVKYTGTPCSSALSEVVVVSNAVVFVTPVINGPNQRVLCLGDSLELAVSGIPNGFVLQWLKNNQPIAGANLPALTVWESGNYAARLEYAACQYAPSSPVEVRVEDTLSSAAIIKIGPDTLVAVTGDIVPVSFQWLLNGTPIAGATAKEYKAAENGFYECVIISENGCQYRPGLQAIVVSTDLPAAVRHFLLAPNPTSGAVRLRLELQQSERVGLSVRDAQQRQVFKKSLEGQRIETEIDLRMWPAGTYYLQVQLESGSFVRPIVRQ